MRLACTRLSHIELEACVGAGLDDCRREAVLMAATEWREVVLTHGGVRYRIKPDDILLHAVKPVEP
jgi:hypothetical protein